MLPAEAVGFAVAQYGLTSTAQLHASGLSNDSIAWLSSIGELIAERRHVWRIAGTPDLPEQPLMAALLAAGSGAHSSTWSAGAVLGLPKTGFTVPVYLTSMQKVRMKDVVYHRPSVALLERDVTIRRGLRTTTAARTICDSVRTVDGSLIQPWVDDVIRRRLTTVETLDETCARFEALRARKIELVRAAIERIIPGQEKTDNDFELEALREIAKANLPLPFLQFQVTIDGRVYVIDLAWPRYKLGVELKGFHPHGGRAQWDYDTNIKENAFRRIGWAVYAYTSIRPWDLMIRDITRHLVPTRTRPAAY